MVLDLILMLKGGRWATSFDGISFFGRVDIYILFIDDRRERTAASPDSAV